MPSLNDNLAFIFFLLLLPIHHLALLYRNPNMPFSRQHHNEHEINHTVNMDSLCRDHQQYLCLYLDSRSASVPEAIPQPESLGRLRHSDRASDEDTSASESRSVDRPEAMDSPERSSRLRHSKDEEKTKNDNVKSPTISPGSLGPSSADVIPTPELVDYPRHREEVGRGTDKGFLSYTPKKDDVGMKPIRTLKRNTEEEVIVGHSRQSNLGGKPYRIDRNVFSVESSLQPDGAGRRFSTAIRTAVHVFLPRFPVINGY